MWEKSLAKGVTFARILFDLRWSRRPMPGRTVFSRAGIKRNSSIVRADLFRKKNAQGYTFHPNNQQAPISVYKISQKQATFWKSLKNISSFDNFFAKHIKSGLEVSRRPERLFGPRAGILFFLSRALLSIEIQCRIF